MKSLEELQRNWEGLAQSDPLWAICSDPDRRNRQWNREEFFATGKREVAVVLKCLADIGVKSDFGSPVLDFGCGVGRLTQAMAGHFPECWGVDISSTMIGLAREFSQGVAGCRFVLNQGARLEAVPDNYFGFAYSSIVLQHIAPQHSRGYIAELVRVLRPGGALVFQLPDSLRAGLMRKVRAKLKLRSRLHALLRGQLSTIEMHCMKEAEVRRVVDASGAQVVDVRFTNSTEPAFCGDLKYLEEEPKSGYISKQYCVVKRT
jgi:ubiquinone/menaquinone biosynthesis C-methylase UbiE